jgi:purine-nucleoside phosphorylase
MVETLKRHLSEATILIRDQMPHHPKIGIILGSGLSGFADSLERAIKIPYAKIPHFSPPTVEGHGGNFVCGFIAGIPVAVMQGRIHYYEGHEPEKVIFSTRVLAQLGVKTLLVTNASGGLDPKMAPGDFMIIRDQINLTGQNPLRGPNPDFIGPRFPDMSEPFDPFLADTLKASLKQLRARFSEGVYCGVNGPCYETAAEVRYLHQIGGHAVGMSTVFEVIAARHAGLRVAGLSCITNLATGLSRDHISHDDVKSTAKKVEGQFNQVLRDFVQLVTKETH